MQVHYSGNIPVIATFDLTPPKIHVSALTKSIKALEAEAITLDLIGNTCQATAIFEVINQLQNELDFLTNLPCVFWGEARCKA